MAQKQGQSPRITIWIIWGSMLSTLFIYALVLFMVTKNADGFTPPEPDLVRMLLLVFGGISLSEVGAIFMLRKTTFFNRLEKGAFDTLEKLRGAYQTTCILSWGLTESIAIYGFVLAFLTHDLTYYLYFAPPAIVLFLVLRPQLARHEEALEAELSQASSDSMW